MRNGYWLRVQCTSKSFTAAQPLSFRLRTGKFPLSRHRDIMVNNARVHRPRSHPCASEAHMEACRAPLSNLDVQSGCPLLRWRGWAGLMLPEQSSEGRCSGLPCPAYRDVACLHSNGSSAMEMSLTSWLHSTCIPKFKFIGGACRGVNIHTWKPMQKMGARAMTVETAG